MVAGIDIGGSGTKACLLAADGLVAQIVMPTNLAGHADIGAVALTALGEALAEAGAEATDLMAIGIGIPGQVQQGWVRHAANLGIDANGFDLGGHVSSATQVPAIVENDMRAAAYGAFHRSSAAGRPVRHLVYVGIGTGVSAGVILDGVIHRGHQSLAGEFGHVPMGTGIECACGAVGCLETLVGSDGLRQVWTGDPALTLIDAAARGDGEAVLAVDPAIDHLARAMWWLAAAYDPDIFYVGGGVGASSPFITDRVAARWVEMANGSDLARRILDPRRLRMYDLGEPVGAYGAALLALDGTLDDGISSLAAGSETLAFSHQAANTPVSPRRGRGSGGGDTDNQPGGGIP